jgi:hypothetical protein
MRRIKYVGLALVAVFAMSVVASASAHEFEASAPGNLTSKVLQTQTFHTAAGNVECSALHLTGGSVTQLKTGKQEATVQYTGCKAFGLAATISPALYLFDAEGSVKVLKTITITAVGCTVTVPSAKNTSLTTIVYKNASGGQITLEPSVKNITSSGTGSACTYAEESLGTYTGTSDVGLVGGTLTWK